MVEIWEFMRNYGGHMGKYEEIWEFMRKYGGYMGIYEEVWWRNGNL